MEPTCRKCGFQAPTDAIHCPRCGEPLYSFPGWRILAWSIGVMLVGVLAWGYAAHWF